MFFEEVLRLTAKIGLTIVLSQAISSMEHPQLSIDLYMFDNPNFFHYFESFSTIFLMEFLKFHLTRNQACYFGKKNPPRAVEFHQ